ncbi:hypothetical protein LJC17_01475 [Acholeplasma sp. OttesenSCG-928-E16]|nr:hypothetical protein [Acholeplasma sp. OttesenSCG-928-E16]
MTIEKIISRVKEILRAKEVVVRHFEHDDEIVFDVYDILVIDYYHMDICNYSFHKNIKTGEIMLVSVDGKTHIRKIEKMQQFAEEMSE